MYEPELVLRVLMRLRWWKDMEIGVWEGARLLPKIDALLGVGGEYQRLLLGTVLGL